MGELVQIIRFAFGKTTPQPLNNRFTGREIPGKRSETSSIRGFHLSIIRALKGLTFSLLLPTFPHPDFPGFSRSRIVARKVESANLAAGNSSGIGTIRLKHFEIGTRAIQHAIKEIALGGFSGLQFQGNIAPVPESQFNDFQQLLLGVRTKHGPMKALRGRIFQPILGHRHLDRGTGTRAVRSRLGTAWPSRSRQTRTTNRTYPPRPRLRTRNAPCSPGISHCARRHIAPTPSSRAIP